MKCSACGMDKKPSQRISEELCGLILPINNPQESSRYMWIIERVGKVLDEMYEELKK